MIKCQSRGSRSQMRAHNRHTDAARRGDVLLPALRASGHLCARTRERLERVPSAEQRVLMLVSRMLPALMGSSALGEASPP